MNSAAANFDQNAKNLNIDTSLPYNKSKKRGHNKKSDPYENNGGNIDPLQLSNFGLSVKS